MAPPQHDMGQISCTPEQIAAIEPLLVMRESDLVDATRAEEAPTKDPEYEEEKHEFRGNAAYLVL